MARVALVAFAAVLVLAAAFPVRTYLTEPHEVLTSTPSEYTGGPVALAVPPHGRLCQSEILFDTNSRIARFGAIARAGAPAPALEVVAMGYPSGPFRTGYRSVARVAGGWHGTRQLDVPLRPPHKAAFGTLCVSNASERAIDLAGTAVQRAPSRAMLTINGEKSDDKLTLHLLDTGRSSYVARSAQIMSHASTLRPFGAWWWWLLTVAGLALAPLGVGLAIRFALEADGRPVSVRVGAWPSDWVRRRIEAVPGSALLAGVGVVAVIWLFYWGANTHVFQNDEDQYVYLSRWLREGFPSSLWAFAEYQRGLQRLEVWLLAVPAWLTDSPWSLVLGRLLNTVAFVSTAIPVYLMGRGMGLPARWAALPAALSAAVPWAVVTTAFLTENLAYPAFAWVVWAVWRTAHAPAPRRDLLALVLIVVAGLSRTVLLALAPLLPAVALATGLRCGEGAAGARLRTVLRDHAVLWAAVGLGLLALVAGSVGLGPSGGLTGRLAGGYGTPLGFQWGPLLDKTGAYLARAVIGTGFLPAAVGLPWLAVTLARAREARRFAFALTIVLSALALFYMNHGAGPDERYMLYLAPLLLLPATLAVARREISSLGVGIASALLAVLLVRVSWNADQGAFGFFVSPVEMFYSRAIGLKLDPYLPGNGGDVVTLASVALGIGGVALAVVLRRAPGRLAGGPGAVLVAAVAVAIVVQTQYTLSKHVNGVGSRSGAGLRTRAFVDRTVPKGPTVGELAEGVGREPGFTPIWQEVQFYNERIDRVVALGHNVNAVPTGDALIEGVGYDERTGRIRSPQPLPDYLVIPTQIGTATQIETIRPRGGVLRGQTYIPVALMRLDKPATLAWRTEGLAPDGSVAGTEGATVRVYGTGLTPGAHCAALTFAGPADQEGTWSLRLGRRTVGAGTVAPGKTARVPVALPGLVEQGFLDVRITGRASRLVLIDVDQGC